MSAKIARVLVKYENLTEEVVEVQRLWEVDLEGLAEHFDLDLKSDPQLLNPISLLPEDLLFLKTHYQVTMDTDVEHFSYTLEAVEDDLS